MNTPTILAVDYENVYQTLGRAPFNFVRGDAREKTLDLLAALRQQLAATGHEIAMARAFADWEAVRYAQRPLALTGIEPMYVAAQREKSSADIALSLDVLAAVLGDDRIGHVALVGGDRDYLPLAQQLRSARRTMTIAALACTLPADLRTFMADWPGATVVELDQWVGSEEGKDRRDRGGHSQRDDSEDPVGLDASDETPPTEPSVAPNVIEPGRIVWTPEHDGLARSMIAFMESRGFDELHVGPFFRYLRDQEPVGPHRGADPGRLLDDLKAMGLVEVETRPGRNGFTFSVARLHQDRLPACCS